MSLQNRLACPRQNVHFSFLQYSAGLNSRTCFEIGIWTLWSFSPNVSLCLAIPLSSLLPVLPGINTNKRMKIKNKKRKNLTLLLVANSYSAFLAIFHVEKFRGLSVGILYKEHISLAKTNQRKGKQATEEFVTPLNFFQGIVQQENFSLW